MRVIDDHRALFVRQAFDDREFRERRGVGPLTDVVVDVSEAGQVTAQLERSFGRREENRGEIVRHQALDATQRLLGDRFEVERLGHRGGSVS